MEIPFTPADLENVRLDANEQAVNFTVRKPRGRSILLRFDSGEYGLEENLLSMNFPFRNTKNRISLESKQSRGSRSNRDFGIYNVSFDSFYEGADKEFEFVYGYLKKDFGAGGFYAAPLFNREEEHTTQQFFSFRSLFKEDCFDIQFIPFVRRHFDKFILDRDNPSFYTNYSTTYVYGFNSRIKLNRSGVFFKPGLRIEKVSSTRLGNHKRIRDTFTLGVVSLKFAALSLNTAAGADYYNIWRWQGFINIDARYFLKNNLYLSFSFNNNHRIPSFTELFYYSPANRGNHNLNIQKMSNFQWGFGYDKEHYRFRFDVFLKQQRDTIDWVRNIEGNPWQAENAGDIITKGVDIGLVFYPKCVRLKKVSFNYTFLDLAGESRYRYSKYLSNYLKHKLLLIFKIYLSGRLLLVPALIIEKPVSTALRATSNLKITYKINNNLSVFLEGKNILNKGYEEVPDVEADPRWWKGGFLYRF